MKSIFITALFSFTAGHATLHSPIFKLIEDIYVNKSGHGIHPSEIRMIQETGGDPTYGEITLSGASKLLRVLKLRENDVFVDLGSGVGKLVMQVALLTKTHRVRGIELAETRHKHAMAALKRLQSYKPDVAPRITYEKADFITADLEGTTIAFMCSTCFSDVLLENMTKKLAATKSMEVIATLRPLKENDAFDYYGTIRLPMTWSPVTPVHIYTRKNMPNRSMPQLSQDLRL